MMMKNKKTKPKQITLLKTNTMPAPKSQEEMISALKILPPVLANFLASNDTADAIEEIEKHYELEPAATLQLINAISWFTAGFLSSKEMGVELQKIAPRDLVSQFKKDVVAKIFTPYAKEFRENGVNFERIASAELLADITATFLPDRESITTEISSETEVEPKPSLVIPESKPTPPPVIISAPPKTSAPVMPLPTTSTAPIPASTLSSSDAPATMPQISPALAATPATTIGAKISAALPRKPTEPQPATAAIPKPAPTPPPQTGPRSFALPRITIAAEKSKTPMAQEAEPIKKESEPLPIPRPVRYTTPQPIREIPQIISPHGMPDNRPAATTTPQPSISQPPPPPASAAFTSPSPKTVPVSAPISPASSPLKPQKSQSPIIDLSTFQVVNQVVNDETVRNATPIPNAPTAPITQPSQPTAKGNTIDLK